MDKIPTPPGYTSDVDKYYIELAHYIIDQNSLYLTDSATPSLEELELVYEHAKSDYEFEKTPENELTMLKAHHKLLVAQNEKLKERKTDFKSKIEKPSAFFPKIKVSAGLKTRKQTQPNGSSWIRRHRSRRVSNRKIKA